MTKSKKNAAALVIEAPYVPEEIEVQVEQLASPPAVIEIETPVEQIIAEALEQIEAEAEAPQSWRLSRRGARVTINGVSAPRVDTLCGAAWDLFDRCYGNGIVDTSSIVAQGADEGLNRGNLRTELSTWRRFHGIARPAKRS